MSETRPEPAPRRGRKAYAILAVVAGLAIGGYAAHHWWARDRVSTDDAQVEADVVPLVSRVSGPIADIRVHDNQPVKAGDVILAVDPTDHEVRVHQLEADLEASRAQADVADAQAQVVRSSSSGGLSTARAQLTGAGAAVRTATAEVAAAEAALARTRSDLTKADADLARAARLRERDAIQATELESTQADRASALAARDQAEAKLAAAREQRRLAESRVGEAEGRVTQSAPVDQQVAAADAAARLAHARVKSAEAALEQARNALSYATVRAPVDGSVSKLAVHAGQAIQPGQLLVMLVPSATYVVANFKETEVGRIRAGDHVDVAIDALPDRAFHGVVDSIAAATGARMSLLPPDNATGNFVKVVQRVPVKIAWDSADATAALRAGLSAEVTVHTH